MSLQVGVFEEMELETATLRVTHDDVAELAVGPQLTSPLWGIILLPGQQGEPRRQDPRFTYPITYPLLVHPI